MKIFQFLLWTVLVIFAYPPYMFMAIMTTDAGDTTIARIMFFIGFVIVIGGYYLILRNKKKQ